MVCLFFSRTIISIARKYGENKRFFNNYLRCRCFGCTGFSKIKVIDFDRIEERNLSTQPYYRSDVGAFKARILANNLYRAIGTKIEIETTKLTAKNTSQLLKNTNLVIDTFDNSIARQAVEDFCQNNHLPCLQVGLAEDYAEIIWNDIYIVASALNDDICDYPLARNLVILTVAVASEVIIKFVITGELSNYTITLKDLKVTPYLI